MEKTIVKAFAKHMCERYFKSFVWVDGICKPDIECGENELLTVHGLKDEDKMVNYKV